MAHNILLTSLSAADSDLPVRSFSVQNVSGSVCFDSLLDAESVGSSDPSVIAGFTACDSLETLQDVLFAYYHAGYVRNKISHADAGAMDRRNLASDGSEVSALAWMTDSIDLFIGSYEKALAEAQDKELNIAIITGKDVRTAAENMRHKR